MLASYISLVFGEAGVDFLCFSGFARVRVGCVSLGLLGLALALFLWI